MRAYSFTLNTLGLVLCRVGPSWAPAPRPLCVTASEAPKVVGQELNLTGANGSICSFETLSVGAERRITSSLVLDQFGSFVVKTNCSQTSAGTVFVSNLLVLQCARGTQVRTNSRSRCAALVPTGRVTARRRSPGPSH